MGGDLESRRVGRVYGAVRNLLTVVIKIVLKP